MRSFYYEVMILKVMMTAMKKRVNELLLNVSSSNS